MIQVTRFNQTELIVNADLIEFVEQTPDTVITMTTGRKVLVRETAGEIRERVIAYRRAVETRGQDSGIRDQGCRSKVGSKDNKWIQQEALSLTPEP